MDELMKMIMEAAMESQKQTGQRRISISSSNDDILVKAAKESAKINKILFDEYVRVGFSEEQALEIVTSLLSNIKQ